MIGSALYCVCMALKFQKLFLQYLDCTKQFLKSFWLLPIHPPETKFCSCFCQWNITWGMQVLCILTSFWVLRAPKSWSKHFFQPFSTFLFILSVSTSLRLRTASENWSKYTATKDIYY